MIKAVDRKTDPNEKTRDRVGACLWIHTETSKASGDSDSLSQSGICVAKQYHAFDAGNMTQLVK